MENIKQLVCKNFSRLLANSGFTQKFTAQSIGVNTSTIQRWLSVDSCPELENIEKLARLFEVDPVEFYQTDGPSVTRIKEIPVSAILARMQNIPDKVYELARYVSIDDEAWETVVSALEVAIEMKESSKAKNRKA